MMNDDLKNSVAIVTAGTEGIGRAIVDLLLEQGASVAACARNQKNLDALQNKEPKRIFAFKADVTNPLEVADFVKKSVERFGKVDHLFFNAAPLKGNKLSTLSSNDWDLAYNSFIKTLVTATESVIPTFKKQKSGSIVVVTSLAAVEPIDTLATSSVFRAGLNAWVKLMAREYGPFNIRTNAVLPGYIQTGRLESHADELAKQKKTTQKEIFEGWSDAVALNRLGKPSEIANAVVFLASPAASYITGTTLLVDGGIVRGV